MRAYVDAHSELWANPDPVERNERLREAVDDLPRVQQHLVSRVYFGGAPLTQAAVEVNLTVEQANKSLGRALGRLRRALQEED